MGDEEIQLDWAAAEVHEGELTVPLSGETPKGFKKAFRHTVRLLGEHAQWGEVELHKGTVHVSDVQSGQEATLRHHLEAIVTQVNAKFAQEAAGEQTSDRHDQPDGQDAEMTERFRAFAEPAEDQAD